MTTTKNTPACTRCGSSKATLAGRIWLGGHRVQQYQCQGCGRRFAEKKET